MSAALRRRHTSEDIWQETLLHAWRDRDRCEWRGLKSNRLIAVFTSGPPSPDDKKLEFAYDYMDRRVKKRVVPWNPNLNEGEGGWDDGNPDQVRKFVWAGWLLLLELDGLNGDAVIRKYTWGLDLSNSLQGAGGLGGLLATLDANGTATTSDDKSYAYFYDGAGNVGQLVEHDGTLAAHYEYTPYGDTVAAAGPYAKTNPFRFSTKYLDTTEDGQQNEVAWFYYFGYRYYSSRLGRWIKRDPIGEIGGTALYVYAFNQPTNLLDPLGLSFSATPACIRALLKAEFYDLARIKLEEFHGTIASRNRWITGNAVMVADTLGALFENTTFKIGSVKPIISDSECCKDGRLYAMKKRGSTIYFGLHLEVEFEVKSSQSLNKKYPTCPSPGTYYEIELGVEAKAGYGAAKGKFKAKGGLIIGPDGIDGTGKLSGELALVLGAEISLSGNTQTGLVKAFQSVKKSIGGGADIGYFKYYTIELTDLNCSCEETAEK